MKINLKEYLKLSFIYTLVTAIPPALQVIALPIIESPDLLDAIQFSHLAITESIIVLVFTFSIFAMNNATARFYYDEESNPGNLATLISTIFSSIIFRGFLALFLGLIFESNIGKLFPQEELRDFSVYGYYCIIIGINRAINLTTFTLLRNKKAVRHFVVLNVVLGFLRTGLQVAAVLYIDNSFLGYIYGTLIGTSIISLSNLILIFNQYGFHFNFSYFKQVNAYSRPLFINGMLTWGLLFADRYFLKFNDFEVELGIYDIAMKYVLGIQIVFQGLQGATQPEVYRLMKAGMKENWESIRSYFNILSGQGIALIACIIPLLILFIDFTFETEIRQSASIIVILIMLNIMRNQFVIFSFPIYYLKKTSFFLYLNTGTLLVNLSLNFLLVPIYKEYGSIISIIATYLLQMIFSHWYQGKITGQKVNINKTLVFPLVLLVIAGIFSYFSDNLYLNALSMSAIMFIGLLTLYLKDIKKIYSK